MCTLSARIGRRRCGLPRWCLFLCFQPVCPGRVLGEMHTLAPRPVLSRLFPSCLPPRRGLWEGARRALCSLSHGRSPSPGRRQSFRARPLPLRAPPRPTDAQPRGLSGRPAGERGVRTPAGIAPLLRCHLLTAWGGGEALCLLWFDGLWFPLGTHVLGPWDLPQRGWRGAGGELLRRIEPLPHLTGSGGDWGLQFSHEQMEAQRGAATRTRSHSSEVALEPRSKLAPSPTWEDLSDRENANSKETGLPTVE